MNVKGLRCKAFKLMFLKSIIFGLYYLSLVEFAHLFHVAFVSFNHS